MNRGYYATSQPRTDIAATTYLDTATNEALDQLARKLGRSHSETLRMAVRNLAAQHGIGSKPAVPRHPDLITDDWRDWTVG